MAALEKTGMTQEAGQAGRAGPAVPSESAGTAAPEHGAPGWCRRLGAALEELWIALLGWIPTPVGLALRLAGWRWLFARCGSVRFSTGLSLAGCRGMCLGSNVRLGRGCFITATDGELVLHDNVALSPYVHVGADAGRIEIGAHTAVGPGTVIRAANHCIARQDVPMMHQGHVPGEIIIEEDVWIGANCVRCAHRARCGGGSGGRGYPQCGPLQHSGRGSGPCHRHARAERTTCGRPDRVRAVAAKSLCAGASSKDSFGR